MAVKKRKTARKAKTKTIKLYACGTVATDIAIGADKVVLYTSIKALKKNRKCWKECGIVSIDYAEKIITKGKL